MSTENNLKPHRIINAAKNIETIGTQSVKNEVSKESSYNKETNIEENDTCSKCNVMASVTFFDMVSEKKWKLIISSLNVFLFYTFYGYMIVSLC